MDDSKEINPENLNIQCVLDKVSITLDENDDTKVVGTGHLTFYIDENPDDKEVLVVRFSDDEDNEKANIVLLSTSTAWSENEKTLVFPRPKGGLWKIDCSKSDEDSFKELQDILTFFIVFENRHNMRNMLVMVDPETCEVRQVVAKDVQLESMDSSGNLMELGENASTEDQKMGEKLSVCIEDPVIDEETEAPKSRRVRILNRSANALTAGSTWISNTITQGGETVAKHISSGGRMIEERIDATENPIKLSDGQKGVFQTAYNTSTTAKNTANGLADRAASMTISGVSSVAGKKSSDDEKEAKKSKKPSATLQLGKSALMAAARVLGSVFKAKRAILKSSRESVVQVVHKKYGEDASLVVDKTICTGYNISCMMVYFDAKGISRRVVTKGAIQTATGKNKKSEVESETEVEIQDEKTDKE